MDTIKHLSLEELKTGLPHIQQSPVGGGVLELIVRRPKTDAREVLQTAQLDVAQGLVGDKWSNVATPRALARRSQAETQLTLMNSRAIALIACQRDRWALAGDQLFIDMDLSTTRVLPGMQFALGSAIIEITAPPHTGCKKFAARFGKAAVVFVNSPVGKQLRLRGVNAKIIQSGTIRRGDVARVVNGPPAVKAD